jgi:hypothetical protein
VKKLWRLSLQSWAVVIAAFMPGFRVGAEKLFKF